MLRDLEMDAGSLSSFTDEVSEGKVTFNLLSRYSCYCIVVIDLEQDNHCLCLPLPVGNQLKAMEDDKSMLVPKLHAVVEKPGGNDIT